MQEELMAVVVKHINEYKVESDPILQAILEKKSKKIIESLLSEKDKTIDKSNISYLLCALTCKNSFDIVQVLVNYGEDIHFIEKYSGKSLLMFALEVKSSKEIIKLLLDSGCNVHMRDHNGVSILLYALQFHNSTEVIQLLIKYGVDVNEIIKTNWRNYPLLFQALNQGLSILTLLIENGADVNGKDNHNKTVLMHALAIQVPIDILSLLIQKGADVNGRISKCAESVLCFAIVAKSSIDIFQLLLDYGADPGIYIRIGIDKKPLLLFALQCELSNDIFGLLFKNKGNDISRICIETAESSAEDIYKEKLKQELKKERDCQEIKKDIFQIFGEKTIEEIDFNCFFTGKFSKTIKEKKDIYTGISCNFTTEENTKLLEILVNKEDIQKDIVLIELLVEKGANVNIFLDNQRSLLEYARDIKNKKLIELIEKSKFYREYKVNPMKLVKLLNHFTIDNPIKFTTHTWKNRIDAKYKNNYELFIEDVYIQFNGNFGKSLKELSPKLYDKIESFAISQEETKHSWCSEDTIKIGWSSLKGLKEHISKGGDPFEYSTSYKKYPMFANIIDLFKKEIEIREGLYSFFDSEIEKLGRKCKITFELSDDLKDLKFYTDVESFKTAIKIFISEIKIYAEKNEAFNIKIQVKKPDINLKYIELHIEHIESYSDRGPKELLDRIKKGKGNSDAGKYLKNLCDWEIKSKYGKEYFTFDCFGYSDDIKKSENPKDGFDGFKHILRFYI